MPIIWCTDTHRILTVMKVETDIINSIAGYVKNFKTDIIVFISNIIMH